MNKFYKLHGLLLSDAVQYGRELLTYPRSLLPQYSVKTAPSKENVVLCRLTEQESDGGDNRVTSQKTVIYIISAVGTSHLKFYKTCSYATFCRIQINTVFKFVIFMAVTARINCFSWCDALKSLRCSNILNFTASYAIRL